MAEKAPNRGRSHRTRNDQTGVLCAQVAQLRAQVAQLRAQVTQQRAEINDLHFQRAVDLDSREQTIAESPGTASRRALLRWGGAAAAAATVAVVAGQTQSARAAVMADGSTLFLGQSNTATSQTLLTGTSANSAYPLVLIDNTQGQHHALEGRGGPDWPGLWGTGSGTGSAGMFAYTDAGYGLAAASTTGIDLAVIGSGRIWQSTQIFAGAPASGSFNQGESIRDSNGDLWLCIAGDGTTTGTWVKVAAIPAGAAGGAPVLFPVPFRVFDTRPGVGALGGGGPMSAGQIITVQVTGTVDPHNSSVVVPAGATGIIADLIAISASGTGFLGIQPSTGSANPYAWVNYTPDVTIHNSVVVGLSSDGKVDIQCNQASAGAALTITGYIV